MELGHGAPSSSSSSSRCNTSHFHQQQPTLSTLITSSLLWYKKILYENIIIIKYILYSPPFIQSLNKKSILFDSCVKLVEQVFHYVYTTFTLGNRQIYIKQISTLLYFGSENKSRMANLLLHSRKVLSSRKVGN